MANRIGSVAYARIRADILALARSIPTGRMTTYGALAGWIDIRSATVTPSRRIHPQVEKSDMYMWSTTNT